MTFDNPVLGSAGVRRFQELRSEAIDAVSQRFQATLGADYIQFGQRGRDACREDLAFHLDFLLPVLEFGLFQPMVDYLTWLAGVLAARDVPARHLGLSLDWLGEFFAAAMEWQDAQIVVAALHGVQSRFILGDNALPAIYSLLPERWGESDAFEEALLQGDRKGAESVFDGLLAQGHGLVDAEIHVIQPALYGIGQKWQKNLVTVAQEHLATAISQSVMTKGLLKCAPPVSNGRRVMLACVEGNHHAVGLQMVADAFQLAGWDTQFLGANVPTRALIAHLAQSKPALLGLSVSFAQQLRVVKDIMAQLSDTYGNARIPVIIGGLAINQFSRLADELGADAWSANAGSAIASASKLPALPGTG